MMTVELVPVGHRVARWIRAYGSAEFYSPERYGTADGTVPWPRFLILEREIDSLLAGEQLRVMQGMQHGYAAARSDSRELSRITDDLIERAYPSVSVRRLVRFRADEEM